MLISEPSTNKKPQIIFMVNTFFENLKNVKDIITLKVELQSIYLYFGNLKYNYLKDNPNLRIKYPP